MSEIKRIDIKEFRERGYLQEVNRRLLHPLGLALEVVQDEDGTEHLSGVWDYRDDPEGIYFSDATDLEPKARSVTAELDARSPARQAALGYVIQEAVNV